MKKTAAVAALVLAFAVSGCSAPEDDRAAEIAQQCAELRATVIDGDTATAQAARDSIERTIDQLCD